MFYYLRLDRGGKTHHFPVERSKVLGRSETADIHLRDLRVSRLHCRLVLKRRLLWLEPMSSANVTLINGEALRGRRLLMPGDMIQIGPYGLVVELRQGWLEEERVWERAAAELRRLKRRAMARPITLVLVTLLIAGAAGLRKSGKPKFFDATVVFVLEEIRGEDGRRVPPPPKRDLHHYIFDGVFTRAASLEIVQKFKLFPAKMALDTNWAVERFRDSIRISVNHNEFLIPGDDYQERTARIRIGYSGRSPKEAMAVTRALARRLREHEAAARRNSAKVAEKFMEHQIKRWARKLDEIAKDVAKLHAVLSSDHTKPGAKAQATVQLQTLERGTDHARFQLAQANRRYAQAKLLRTLEQKASRLRFRLVDWSQSTPPAIRPAVRGAITAAVVFVFGLPLVAVVLGMVDRRLYRPEDLERLGIRSLGHIRAHGGQGVASLSARLGQKALPWYRRGFRRGRGLSGREKRAS